MTVEIKVPSMGESITEATVGAILKPSGSQVNMDDELLELETDKVNQVLYAQQAGIVSYSVSPGDKVEIGQVIGKIDSDAKAAAQPTKKIETPTEKEKQTLTPKPTPIETRSPQPAQAIPSEIGGRQSREEYIKETLKSPPSQPQHTSPKMEQTEAKPASTTPQPVKDRVETRKKMTKIRQVIGRRLLEAQHSSAMLTTFNEVDMSQVLLLREKYKELFLKEHGVKLGFMSFFIKATVAALHKCPDLNSYIDQDEIVHREYYDIGVAVSSDRGLMVPVVRNCEQLSFAEIEGAIERHARKAREGGIQYDDLQGGSFTITNGGVFGSLLSTPILNPPQSGILGMHKIEKRAVVINDQIVIRPMMYLALTYDHRIVDGKEAVMFLVEIKNFLEDPARLVLDV